jgi:hypothetical protein
MFPYRTGRKVSLRPKTELGDKTDGQIIELCEIEWKK